MVPWHQVWHQDLVPSGAIIRWPRCPSGGSRRPSREAGSSMSAGDPGCWIRQSCWASWVSACRCEIGIRVVRSHRVGPWRSHSNHPERERQRISTAPRPTPGSHHKAGQSRRGANKKAKSMLVTCGSPSAAPPPRHSLLRSNAAEFWSMCSNAPRPSHKGRAGRPLTLDS